MMRNDSTFDHCLILYPSEVGTCKYKLMESGVVYVPSNRRRMMYKSVDGNGKFDRCNPRSVSYKVE